MPARDIFPPRGRCAPLAAAAPLLVDIRFSPGRWRCHGPSISGLGLLYSPQWGRLYAALPRAAAELICSFRLSFSAHWRRDGQP